MNSLRQRFCKDYNLPIQVLNDEYFEYFLNLYDGLYNCKKLYDMFLKYLDKIGKDNFFNEQRKLIEEVSNHILNKPEYKEFNKMDMIKFTPSLKLNKEDIYLPHNCNQKFISIDLKQANFNSLKFADNSIIDNKDTYEDFINQFTEEEYLIGSKHIRQVIFGKLNVSRQQNVQRFIMANITVKLLKYISFDNIKSTSNDEIIIHNCDSIDVISEILHSVSKELNIPINLTQFTLKQLSNKDFGFIKEHVDGKVEFKSCSKAFFAQAFKEYFNLPLHENDFLFYFDGRLAKFIEE